MKYFLVFTLVLVVFWLWRNNRRADSQQSSQSSAKRPVRRLTLPTEIVACQICHVHLPRAEALIGPGGVYCSAAHRQQAKA